MPKLILRYCTIANPKADFLKHHIKFSVALPLTDDSLKLRDKFELLASEKKSVTVEIESAQLPLFDTPNASEQGTVTLSTQDRSVTVTAEQFHAAAEGISDFTRDVLNDGEENATPRRKARFVDQPEIKRERARKARKHKK